MERNVFKQNVADGKRCFYHIETGELILRRTKRQALKYFKADGKHFGYSTRRNDVRELKTYMKA